MSYKAHHKFKILHTQHIVEVRHNKDEGTSAGIIKADLLHVPDDACLIEINEADNGFSSELIFESKKKETDDEGNSSKKDS